MSPMTSSMLTRSASPRSASSSSSSAAEPSEKTEARVGLLPEESLTVTWPSSRIAPRNKSHDGIVVLLTPQPGMYMMKKYISPNV